MARISDESLKAALVLWKADDKDDVLDYAKTRMGDMLTELQILREIVAVIDSFVKVGESDYCYITTPNCGCMWCQLVPLLKKRDEL